MQIRKGFKIKNAIAIGLVFLTMLGLCSCGTKLKWELYK